MTIDERARKIVRSIELMIHEYNYNKASDVIAAELRVVREEAIEEDRKIWDAQHELDLQLHSQQATASAYEKAAEIAATYWDHIPQEEFDEGFEIPKKDFPDFVHTDIAERIRKLASDPEQKTDNK